MLFAKVSKKGSEVIKDAWTPSVRNLDRRLAMRNLICFSPNVPSTLKDKVCENLGIHATTKLGKYLGFPLRHRGANRSQFNFVAERVISKLVGWKAKFLSFTRRIVLVKFMMTAIPNYVMQGAALPTHLCDN